MPLISRAVKNGDKILIYKNGKFFGKFEILAGSDWVFYNKDENRGFNSKEVVRYISDYNDNPNYEVTGSGNSPVSIFIEDKQEIEESTATGASSGSYQVPFQFKENKNMENNLIEITEEQFNRIVKNILLKEFVYSSAAASATNSNTKSKPTKSTAAQSMKGAEKNMKPNMQDNRPADIKNITDQAKQKEEEQIEREAGGQQDLEFDSISDKAKENFKKQFTAGDKPKIGNASNPDSTVGADMLKRAKKRMETKRKATLATVSLGSDIELNPGGSVKQNKTMAESSKFKKYNLKDNSFLTEEFVDEYLTKYRKFYEGKTFFLEDKYGNRAKINWNKKFPILEGIEDINKKKKYLSLQESLFKNDIDNSINSSRLNEHDIFVNMFKQAKTVFNEN